MVPYVKLVLTGVQVYLLLWFWLFGSSTQICGHCHSSSQVKDAPRKRELTYMILRYVLILIKTRGFTQADLSTCKSVLDRCYLGDWFVLYQLSKYSNTYFFRYLLKHLEKSLYSKVNLTYECKPMICLMFYSQSLTSQASEEEVSQNIQKKEGSCKENWSERSACAALGCWHKRRWPL
jgi:hypothetical protein